MGSRVERTHGRAAAGGPGQARWWLADRVVPHWSADKPGGTTGEQDGPHNPGVQCQEIEPQILTEKT